MPILNRVKRLFQADVHAILDVIEEPEAVLKQAIREMQESLDQKQGQLARSGRMLDALRNNQTRLEAELSKAVGDLALCLKNGPEELSRKTIARKLALQKHLLVIEQRITDLEKLRNEQRSAIEIQQSQLESILEKSRIFVPEVSEEDSPYTVAESILTTREYQRTSPFGGHPGNTLHVSEEEIELEWMRMQENSQKGEEK